MRQLKELLQGMIIGLGKVIPGVSGSVFAVLFGVYEPLIESISSFRSFRKNFGYIIYILIGIAISIIFGSQIICKVFDTFYYQTMYLFLGMMFYGIVSFKRNIDFSDINFTFIFLITLVLICTSAILASFSAINISSNRFSYYIEIFFVGIIETLTAIIPGISGTSILMSLGYYDDVLKIFSNPFGNILISTIFAIGIFIGILMFSKLVSYLFSNYKNKTNFVIFLLSCFSFILLVKNLIATFNIIYILFFIVGYIVSYFFENKIGN